MTSGTSPRPASIGACGVAKLTRQEVHPTMTILNYSTKVSADRTATQIQSRLVKARAQAVMMEYDDDGVLTHLAFRVPTQHGVIAFRLPANVGGVYQVMMQDPAVPRSKKTKEQAARVAWRICRTWVEAQLAVIEAGMATLPQVFLPYAQLPGGETVYERFERQGLPALTHDS
jgi:hypothetical protein